MKLPVESIKYPLVTMLGLVFVQAFLFGVNFSFAEATGMAEGTTKVQGNAVLAGVKMPEERAVWMQEISDFVSENGLEGREVILYGQIPSLSFYLKMPSAFNPWSDLASYSFSTMEKDMAEMEQNGTMPVVIRGFDQEKESEEDEKWELIAGYMENHNYCIVFQNQRFILWLPHNP